MSPRPHRVELIVGALVLSGALGVPWSQLAAEDGTDAAAHPAVVAADPAVVAADQAVVAADAAVPGAARGAVAAEPTTPRFLTLPLERLSPMQRAIRVRVELEQAELKALSAAYANAADDDAALALQRKIHAVKRAAEIAVLEIQLEYARAEGRQDAVLQLQESLAQFERDGLTGQPAQRPVPNDAQR